MTTASNELFALHPDHGPVLREQRAPVLAQTPHARSHLRRWLDAPQGRIFINPSHLLALVGFALGGWAIGGALGVAGAALIAEGAFLILLPALPVVRRRAHRLQLDDERRRVRRLREGLRNAMLERHRDELDDLEHGLAVCAHRTGGDRLLRTIGANGLVARYTELAVAVAERYRLLSQSAPVILESPIEGDEMRVAVEVRRAALRADVHRGLELMQREMSTIAEVIWLAYESTLVGVDEDRRPALGIVVDALAAESDASRALVAQREQEIGARLEVAFINGTRWEGERP
jgi:hypothetical protein